MTGSTTAQLHFCGFYGKVNYISDEDLDSSYILDSNVVLQLLQYKAGKIALSPGWKRFLRTSKQIAERAWNLEPPRMLVNPVLGIMELTRQQDKPNLQRYVDVFGELICGVYGICAYAPEWLLPSYYAALRAHVSTHPSLALTVERVYSLIIRNEKPSDAEIIQRCEELLNWLWVKHNDLAIVGGPLLYLSIYAIAGSPGAQQFLKVSKASKGDAKSVASNVAWDLLYWLVAEMEYHRGQYTNGIVCTSDKPLALLLTSRIHHGPRMGISSENVPEFVDAYGEFTPVKLKRLESTRLERALLEMLESFLMALLRTGCDATKIGFPYGL